ncbi:MAG: aldehyde dehydrogenase family protein [Acidobacteria bacterium]|nr:aldehyde dehydrogenase family protein [Acidobacteriota bacterium]
MTSAPSSPAPVVPASLPSASTPDAPQPASSRTDLETALGDLSRHRAVWVALDPGQRAHLLGRLIDTFSAVGERWERAVREAEGIAEGEPVSGEEWLSGPYMVLRNLRLLQSSLEDIAAGRAPAIPGPVRTRPDGQVTAQVFPASLWDRMFFPGVYADVWMEPGVTARQLAENQAAIYRRKRGEDLGPGVDAGRLALVLGAGNVSAIGPTDVLYKLFVEDAVVLYKVHPVNEYLGPLFEEGFAPLVAEGFLRIVYGGAEEGDFLCRHPLVDEIHITGSGATVEAIAFGTGDEGAARKRERRPRIDKPITSELGNVSPLIVVPGPWSPRDLAYQAENIVSSLTNNAGFNCNATRVLVQHAGWDRRQRLLDAVREVLTRARRRRAFYPGAADRFARFRAAHPELETYGRAPRGDGEDSDLPWGLVPDVDPARAADPCFTTEAFCGLFSETALEAETPADFLDRAVDFANDTLWGTLNVTLVVHPASLRDPETRAALDRAVANLRYGTVSINHWAAVGFALMTTPWGAFPGHDLYDVGSGQGVVHNALMFDRPQKAVLRSPFIAFPKPPWFVTHRTSYPLSQALADFERKPSLLKLPRIFWNALRG